MQRIGLAVVLALSILAPLAAEAQPAGRLPRVGVIWEGATLPSSATGFGQGLRELGYTEGQNIIVEYRHTAGRSDQFPKFATELIGKQLEILKAAAPQVSRIGVLYNPVNPASRVALEEVRASARTLAVALQVQEVRQ